MWVLNQHEMRRVIRHYSEGYSVRQIVTMLGHSRSAVVSTIVPRTLKKTQCVHRRKLIKEMAGKGRLSRQRMARSAVALFPELFIGRTAYQKQLDAIASAKEFRRRGSATADPQEQ